MSPLAATIVCVPATLNVVGPVWQAAISMAEQNRAEAARRGRESG
jgi:hypothetical protein